MLLTAPYVKEAPWQKIMKYPKNNNYAKYFQTFIHMKTKERH